MKRTSFVFVILAIISILGWMAWLFFDDKTNDTTSKQTAITAIQPTILSYVDTQLASLTLRQKVAGLLILHTPGTDVTTLTNYLTTYQPGGFIFMQDNIPDDIEKLALLTSQLQTNKSLPYLFAVDEEGGVVKRLSADIYPAAMDLKNQPVSVTQAAFNERSSLLHRVGLNLNFGIIADVTDNPNSFIYSRVFGGDPTMVGDRVAAAVKASRGLTLSTLKHFPGHGETEADSHVTIPTTDIPLGQWQLYDKPSFQQGIDAGADAVMFGHLRYSRVDNAPATLSVKWHNILKNRLYFTGLTITDDMIMLQNSGEPQYTDPITNAVGALHAGNTMLLYVLGSNNVISNISIDGLIDGIVAAVNDGKLSQDIINQNARQVLAVRHSLAN